MTSQQNIVWGIRYKLGHLSSYLDVDSDQVSSVSGE